MTEQGSDDLGRHLQDHRSCRPPPRTTALGNGFIVMAGFGVAAFVPGTILGLTVGVAEAIRKGAFEPLELLAAAFLGLVSSLGLTVPAILIAGLPLHLLYRRLGWSDWPRHVLAGALIGWALAMVTGGNHRCFQREVASNLSDWLACLPLGEQLLLSGVGAAAALMFWSVAYGRRPWLVFIGLHAALPFSILALP